jgi:hypothetical protein
MRDAGLGRQGQPGGASQREGRSALGRSAFGQPGEGGRPPAGQGGAQGGAGQGGVPADQGGGARPWQSAASGEPGRGDPGHEGSVPRGRQAGDRASVSREAIRAAIRGEPVPKGALPGFDDPQGDPSSGDRLVLPPHGEGERDPSDNSFPSEAELLKQPPVWERAKRRIPAAPAPRATGEEPVLRAPKSRSDERHRALRRFGVLIALIVVIGGGLWYATMRDKSPGGGAAGTTAAAPTLVPVRPSAVAASSQSGSRVASNVIDGKLGTFWSRLVPSEDAQPFLRFSFSQPVQLARVQIAAGAAGAEFPKRPRPQEIELQFSDGTTLRTTLADRPGFQTVNFRPHEIDRIRLVVLSTYPSSGPQRTSMTEVRFFGVKS